MTGRILSLALLMPILSSCSPRTFHAEVRQAEANPYVRDAQTLLRILDENYGDIVAWKKEHHLLAADPAAEREAFWVRVETLSADSPPDAFFDAAASLVSSFSDGHLAILRPDRGVYEVGFDIEFLKGEGRIGRVFQRDSYQRLAGARVLEVDGVPAAEAARRRLPAMRFGRSVASERAAWTFNFRQTMFDAVPSENLKLKILPVGSAHAETLTIPWTRQPPGAPANRARPVHFSGCRELASRLGIEVGDFKRSVGADFMEGLMVLHLSSFDHYPDQAGYHQILCGMEQVVAEANENPFIKALVLDLYDNTGGNPDLAYQVLARLSPRPFSGVGVRVAHSPLALATIRYNERNGHLVPPFLARLKEELEKLEQGRGGWSSEFRWEPGGLVEPVGPSLRKPWAVVIGPRCMSVCEIFASIVKDQSLAPVWGEPSMGAGAPTVTVPAAALHPDGSETGAPLFESGMTLALPFGATFRTNPLHEPIEGHPVVPDVALPQDSAVPVDGQDLFGSIFMQASGWLN